MSFKRLIYFFLILFLFLLPWQTRVVYAPFFLHGQFWEYGSQSWYATEALLWVVIILAAVDRFRQKSFWARVVNREHFQKYWPRLFFSLLVVLYFFWQIFRSVDPALSYQWLFHSLEGLCLVIILAERPGEARALQTAFWAGGVLQGLLAVWQFFSQAIIHIPGFGLAPETAARLGSFVVETGSERWLRAYGAFGSPNILGGYLALVFVLGFWLYLTGTSRQKVLFTFGQMIVLSGLVLSFSRGAWVAATVGVVAIVIVILPRSPRRTGKNPLKQGERDPSVVPLSQDDKELRNDILKQVFFSFLIILTLFFILRPLFVTRFTPSARLEAKSLTERAGQYAVAWSFIGQHWLLGVGPGAYTTALSAEHPRWSLESLQPVHTIYLLLFAELGLVGSILFFWWCALLIRRMPRSGEWLPLLFVLGMIGLFDHWLMSLYIGQIIWWVIFGLALA